MLNDRIIFNQKVRQRELKFFEQKKNETIKELHRYGIEITDQLDSEIIPIAYITGEKVFNSKIYFNLSTLSLFISIYNKFIIIRNFLN